MDIKSFIRELLFSNDCVIVPGFGGFIGNYFPSRADRTTGTFYPPVKKVTFNRNLDHNDGLLISKISQSAGLNYGDARKLVGEFVRDVTLKLSEGEKVVFDHIGVFSKDRENNLQFEPEAGSNYHLGSYGLESFRFVPLKGYDVRKRVSRHVDREPAARSKFSSALWRAALLVPVIAVMVIIPLKTNLFKSKVETSGLNPLVKAEIENNKKAIDEAISLAPDSGIHISPVTPVEEVVVAGPESAEVKPPVSNERYGVITGSFKSEENARSHIEILRRQGYEPELIEASNGFFRVIAVTCSDLGTAIIKKDSVIGQFPGSWVSKR